MIKPSMRRSDVFRGIFSDIDITLEARKVLESKGWEEFEEDLWWDPQSKEPVLERTVINLYHKIRVSKGAQLEQEFESIHDAMKYLEQNHAS